MQKYDLNARLLVVLNLCCGGALVFLLWANWKPNLPGEASRTSQSIQPSALSQRAQLISSVLAGRLEEPEKDISTIADLATNIFSHPDSYRLAPQPGEYDYSNIYGVYGSTKDDGNAALFLSASTPLNPEILHDVRLVEYLSPPFKSLLRIHPDYRSIILCTTDSLICSYPWIDFGQRLRKGFLKPDFKSSEFSFFVAAAPGQNAQKKSAWSFSQADEKNAQKAAYCSAPFFANEVFKGVVAVECNLDSTVSHLLEKTLETGELALLLDPQGSIIAMSLSAQGLFHLGKADLLPSNLNELLERAPNDMRPILQKFFEQSSEVVLGEKWAMQVASVPQMPLRVALLCPYSPLNSAGSILTGKRLDARLIWGTLLLAALVFLNALWIYQARRKVERTSRQLHHSFSALASLDLHSARILKPDGAWTDLLEKFNDALEALQKDLDTLSLEEIRHAAHGEGLAEAATDLEVLSQKAEILSCFSAENSMESTLDKLNQTLKGIFSVEYAGFLFPSADEQFFRGRVLTMSPVDGSQIVLPLEISQNGSLGMTLKEKGEFILNSQEELEKEGKGTEALDFRNVLLALLSDQQKRLGVVVLANKDSSFGAWDQERLRILKDQVSRVLTNLLQCEGYRQIDSLRRQYCQELFNVVEEPLNRIKAEVQSIYSRLGRLTPYYKEHCEYILFEVGRLYEIAHEASALEDLSPKAGQGM
jgi:hypothetical protein